MPLKKAPIVEAWVEVQFIPNEAKEAWSREVGEAFVQRFEDRFKVQDYRVVEEISVGPSGRRELRSYVQRVRAKDESEARWLQVGDDLLVYNIVCEPGKPYVGYDALASERIKILQDYFEEFQPRRIGQISIAYVDMVKLPLHAEQTLRIEDYLRIYVQTPESFGPLAAFEFRAAFPETAHLSMFLSCEAEPPTPGEQELSVRLEWVAVTDQGAPCDAAAFKLELDKAHGLLKSRFKEAFTEKMWRSFEPAEEV